MSDFENLLRKNGVDLDKIKSYRSNSTRLNVGYADISSRNLAKIFAAVTNCKVLTEISCPWNKLGSGTEGCTELLRLVKKCPNL